MTFRQHLTSKSSQNVRHTPKPSGFRLDTAQAGSSQPSSVDHDNAVRLQRKQDCLSAAGYVGCRLDGTLATSRCVCVTVVGNTGKDRELAVGEAD
ncbi:hypothetical protein BaRGS_00005004 [Batillaria attramentaria]|uniref:Uncharacterized protein n=1 Tax=Batillaria attramentaria TaxID=370345 RepID=A0ABD0LXN6_9CAEN